MGEISVKDWSGGLNKRFPGNRIAENECQDATDLNLTNFKLSPVKGVDTGNTASGDYKFRGEWVEDANADKFVEYGTTLLKSYDSGNKLATFTRLKSSGGTTSDKDIGVPPKPASPPTVSDLTTGEESHEEALCYHSLAASFGKTGTAADANTGGLDDINTSVDAAHIHYSSSRIATFDGTSVKVYNDAWAQQGSTLVPTYTDKWWFQGDYWVGVSSTGVSKILITTPALVNTPLTVLSYTAAAYTDSDVSNATFNTANGYTDGWVSGTTDDYWSATSSEGQIYISRVREGHWWTHNAPFYYGSSTDTGRVQAKVRNGTASDSNGFGRTFLVIRKADSTLNINGYADATDTTISSVSYRVKHPLVDSVTSADTNFKYELYDMHPNLNSSIGYVGAKKGWAYLSSESVFKNYFTGLSDQNYFIPGYFEANGEITFELTGATSSDFLIVLGFSDGQSTFTTTTNKSWAFDKTIVSNTSINFVSAGSSTLMFRWDEVKKIANYINRSRAESDNTDESAFNLTYPDPHQYKGQTEYLWGNLDSSIRTGVSTHNTGSVYKIRSTHLSKVAVAGSASPSEEFHNEDNVIEPDYADQTDGTNKNVYKNIWDWREANRALTLCGNVEGTINGFFLSATVTDSHANASGTGTVRIAADTVHTKAAYDSGVDTFASNNTEKTSNETSSSISSSYKEAESLKSFNAFRVTSVNYVFFARDFSRWGDGSYIFKAIAATTDFAADRATATITITDYSNIAVGTTIVLTDTSGVSKTFTSAVGSSGTDHDTWMVNESNDTTADNLFTMLNLSGNESYLVDNPPANVVTITQATGGTAGNVTVTSSDSVRVAVTGFSDGAEVASWSGFDLAHSHVTARVNTDRVLFYNPNLDSLIPSTNALQTRRSYGISGTVLKAKYLPSGDGNFLLYTPERNETYVVNTATNEEAVYTLPYDEVIRYDTSDDMFYGFQWDNITDFRYEIYYKAYVWWFSELIGKEFKNGSTDLATIRYVFPVAGSSERTRHILLEVTNAAKTIWAVQNYTVDVVVSVRTPRIVAIPETMIMVGTVTAGPDVLTLTSIQDKLRIQIGDTVSETSNTAKVNGKTDANLVVTLDASGLSLTAGTSFTVTRYVHKNRFWVHRADYTKIKPFLDVAAFDSTVYVSGDQDASELLFTSHPSHASTPIEHLPIGRSARDIIFMGDYFYVDLDKNLVTGVDGGATANHTLNAMNFNLTESHLKVEGGIAYQYRYSFLRDLAESGEKHTDGTVMRFLLEGPPSDETPELGSDLSANDSFARLSFSSADIPSEVSKVRLYRVGGDYARYGLIGDLTVQRTSPTDGKIGSFDDTSRTVAALTIQPNIDKNPPSQALTNITNVSGIFFAADDSRLYFSEFGNYHSFNEAAYVDFDSRITGVAEFMGEGIVFTDGEVFRVRGYNPFEMTKIAVPDVRGLPENNRRTLTKWGTNIVWLGNEGVCLYSNGGVQIISNAKGELDLFKMTLPRGVVRDNVYYLLQTPIADVERKGFAIDFRKGIPPCITRIVQDAESVISVPTENRVFIKNSVNPTVSQGAFVEGDYQSIDFTSKQYDAGDVNTDKVFMNSRISYSGEGTVKFFADDDAIAFAEKTLTQSTNRRLAFIYPTFAKQAKQFHYTVTGSATVFEMKMIMDLVTDYDSPRIFKWADVTYSGAPSFSISLDREDTETTPALDAVTVGVKTVRVSFRGGVSGFIPHYRDASDTGEIIKVEYETEEA